MAAAAVIAPVAPLESTFPSLANRAVPQTPDNDRASTNQTSNLLVEKMTAVLRDMGYEDAVLAKVSNRANSNIVEATDISADEFLGDSDSLARLIDIELLNEQKLRAIGVYVNSNEPVLLLEASRDLKLSAERIHGMKDEVVAVLRRRGVKPVRVYVRLTEASESEEQQPHIGMVLLNVVNTDIGGPSMVQLLDSGFHGREWKKALVLKEGWNGEELLWRDEAWMGPEVEVQAVVEAASEPRQLGRTDVPAETADDAPADAPTETDLPARAGWSQYKDVNAVPEDEDDEAEPEVIEHPAMKELREREAQRGEVQHPTWSRIEDDPGLLDIITTQSSRAKDTDPISIIATRSAESSDDGFEVVEKV